ncbi:glycoside hydrolase family 32 protein [Gramella sp. AN32]|uniref:Glycoside hydrolase family 32 protein n=1 Tax=Christiangramia antarctica TaxID=2058158 RepID=A0ABW5X993_9FLAO|nr:glycoside hydrolase family 32 protein [Gramella sp. AN32]MCM4155463.1 glycosyl hydrolase family 32 [Gramella sp. AN32]
MYIINMKKPYLLALVLLIFLNGYGQQNSHGKISDLSEKNDNYRPNFHFTPKKNWMNDPNGMFYLNGTYHLFFQHYPEEPKWGPMHWGHATSKDLIRWEEKSIALYPDEKGYIFSGSAVVDKNNTSGLGKNGIIPIIAMFTYHDIVGERNGEEEYQSQAIAFSLDEGMTWTKYSRNPVISNPGIRDFRDPKIQWDGENQQWLMVLSANDKTLIYTSGNLLDWELASEFGKGVGGHGGVWECPDFFPIKVSNTNETKWVLIQSLNPGAYNGGSGTQYFIGDFDGKNFIPENYLKDLPAEHDYWLDFGKDNYAGVTWSNAPHDIDERVFIGWMSNWQYAQEVPTYTWRSAMTIPRVLEVKKKNDNTYRIFSKPVKQLDSLSQLKYSNDMENTEGEFLLADKSRVNMDKLRIKLQIPEIENREYRFELKNSTGDQLVFGYNDNSGNFFIDRRNSGNTGFSENFANRISTAPRTSDKNILPIEIFIDKTSVEIFYDSGETVMTEIFFPHAPMEKLSLQSQENDFSIKKLKVYELQLN